MQSSLGYSIFCPSTNNNNISNIQPKSKYIKKNKRQNKQTNKNQDPYSFTTFVECFNNKKREGHTPKIANGKNKSHNGHNEQEHEHEHEHEDDNDEYDRYNDDNDDEHEHDNDKHNDKHNDRYEDSPEDSQDDSQDDELFRNRIEGFTDNNDDGLHDFVADDVNKKTTANNMPYPYYIPYYDQMSGSNNKSNTLLLNKLDYLIQLLEQQQQYKTEGTTEEIVLYLFLGIFIIYVIDSFARAGKYTR